MAEETEQQAVENQEPETEKQQEGEASSESSSESGSSEEGVVYIGKKPFMNYVIKAKKELNQEGENEVVIKAKGKLINRAIDAVEMLRKRFLKNKEISVEDVKIDSEFEKNNKNKEALVSNVEITVKAK